MRKAALTIAAATALTLSMSPIQPARADGGATLAIILGVSAVSTVGCYHGGGPVLCALSPIWWVDEITHPRGTVYVKSRKGKKKKKM